MVKVFSNNQEFNISKSLYESIMKNNPELLQEDFNMSSENLDMLKHIFKEKFPGVEWNPDIEKKVLSMYIKSRQKSDEFKKALDDNRSTFVPEENSNNNTNTNVNDTTNNRRNDNLVGGYDPKEIAKKLIKQTEDTVSNDDTLKDVGEKFIKLKNSVKNNSKYGNKKREIIGYIDQYINNLKDQYKTGLKNNLSSLSQSEENIKKQKDEEERQREEEERQAKDLKKYNNYTGLDAKEISKKLIDETEIKFKNKIKKAKEEGEEISSENILWKKEFDNLIDEVNNNGEIGNKKKEVIAYINDYVKNELNKKKRENRQNTDKLLGIESNEEINQKGQKKYEEIKNALEKFMFNENQNQRPKGMYDLLKKVKETIKPWLIGNTWQVKISEEGGDRKVYFDNIMYQEFINTVKEVNQGVSVDGIELWKVLKTTDINNIWKNIITIDCRTQKGFSVVSDQIQKQSSYYNGGKIRIIPKSFPSAFKTNSTIYAIIENKREPEDEKAIDNMKINGKPIHENIKDALRSFKRVYFILVTEGMFRKGQMISKAGKTAWDMITNPEKYLGKSISNKI